MEDKEYLFIGGPMHGMKRLCSESEVLSGVDVPIFKEFTEISPVTENDIPNLNIASVRYKPMPISNTQLKIRYVMTPEDLDTLETNEALRNYLVDQWVMEKPDTVWNGPKNLYHEHKNDAYKKDELLKIDWKNLSTKAKAGIIWGQVSDSDVKAVHSKLNELTKLRLLVPNLRHSCNLEVCPVDRFCTQIKINTSIEDLIIHLNDDHRYSFEEIADVLDSLEGVDLTVKESNKTNPIPSRPPAQGSPAFLKYTDELLKENLFSPIAHYSGKSHYYGPLAHYYHIDLPLDQKGIINVVDTS